MWNVWSKIALFIALAAFFVSCTSKAEEAPKKDAKAPVEESQPANDPLKSLDLGSTEPEKEHQNCKHFCKIDLGQ